MILNIILNFPEELNLKVKPSAIREDKVFTLDAKKFLWSQPVLMTMGHMFPKVAQRNIMCTTKRCAGFLIKVKMGSGTFYLKSQRTMLGRLSMKRIL